MTPEELSNFQIGFTGVVGCLSAASIAIATVYVLVCLFVWVWVFGGASHWKDGVDAWHGGMCARKQTS